MSKFAWKVPGKGAVLPARARAERKSVSRIDTEGKDGYNKRHGTGRLSQADRQPIPAYMSCGGQSGSSMSGPVRGERGDRQRSRRSQAGQDPAAA